jgi:hypothetical protein
MLETQVEMHAHKDHLAALASGKDPDESAEAAADVSSPGSDVATKPVEAAEEVVAAEPDADA